MEAKIFYATGWKNCDGFKRVATVEVNIFECKPKGDQSIQEAVLEHLFERFNIGDHGGLQIRSMSVGDVVEFQGVFSECAGCGWVPFFGDLSMAEN